MKQPDPKLVDLAAQLLLIGVSQAVVAELMTYPPEVIQRQLLYLPDRKSRRPAAFIVQAIRKNYSPPYTTIHAHPQNKPVSSQPRMDADPQLPAR